MLRALILGQWAVAVGAAALQARDAYLASIWGMSRILSCGMFPSPEVSVADWAKQAARICLERFETILSGRRALPNTVTVLTLCLFALNPAKKQDNYERFL